MCIATADPDSILKESNETNNQSTITFPVVPAIKDLIVSSFTINPTAPTTADDITFTAIVKNRGNTVTNATTVSIKVGGESQAKAPRYAVPALAPGSFYIVRRTLKLSVAQNYMCTATADPDNTLAENNESNNQRIITFPVVLN
jgi:subtilase family serine protease